MRISRVSGVAAGTLTSRPRAVLRDGWLAALREKDQAQAQCPEQLAPAIAREIGC